MRSAVGWVNNVTIECEFEFYLRSRFELAVNSVYIFIELESYNFQL